MRFESKKWNGGERGCMSSGGEVKRKGRGYVGGGEKKGRKKKWGVGVRGWWKKKRVGDIQREQREKEEENKKGRYFRSCEKINK